MRDVVILSAVRVPTGKFLGALKHLSATDLGAIVVREAVQRSTIDAALVEECILGNVLGAGLGQAPARQAALRGGLTSGVAALTINKVCGSGLKAVMLAAQAIAIGDIDVAVAGGMESMSNAPHLATWARNGLRLGTAPLLDSIIHDGLWDSFNDVHMGLTAEFIAQRYGIDREAQDSYAAVSHHRAAEATRTGAFDDELIQVQGRSAETHALLTDETIRPDTSVEALAKLPPVFEAEGTVTAGNAPGLNDGAAALVLASADIADRLHLSPLARVVGAATTGRTPMEVMMAPVDAVHKVLARVGWALGDVDLIELNEAFAVQAIAVTRELDLDADRVNVNGGAIALGHPIGASGARVLTTLLHALRRRSRRRGVATLCLGGGNGVAIAVERA